QAGGGPAHGLRVGVFRGLHRRPPNPGPETLIFASDLSTATAYNEVEEATVPAPGGGQPARAQGRKRAAEGERLEAKDSRRGAEGLGRGRGQEARGTTTEARSEEHTSELQSREKLVC